MRENEAKQGRPTGRNETMGKHGRSAARMAGGKDGAAGISHGHPPAGVWAAELLELIGQAATDMARTMVVSPEEEDEAKTGETRLSHLLRRARRDWWGIGRLRH